MPYQCSKCKETFQHTAELSEYTPTNGVPLEVAASLKSSVCPFCKSKAYTEVQEEKQSSGINLSDVESLIDCPPNEADTHIKNGYTLFQTWQKNVFLVKLKPKAAGVAPKDAEHDILGDIIKAGIAAAKTAEAPQA